ncbi:hypothetical protein M1466_01555 [Candidatus Dependentiae bacterium]|nr:hypothetical protein [Candidatus Dependentiae bacterium]
MLLQDLAATSGRINDQTLLNQLVQIDESLLQQLASFQENRTRESITATQSPSIANDRV